MNPDLSSSKYKKKLKQRLHALDSKNSANMNQRTGEERNLEELLKEILRLNHDEPRICDLVNKGILRTQVTKVTEAFEADSRVFPQRNKIKYWNKENIRNWANFVKGTEITRDPEFLEEMIAVLKRTNILYCGNDPRLTQVLAILLFESSKEQGRLLQISTGEGKSTICAMLASIKALQGENVDIITSSPILAKRDADERKSFYETLGINCGSNEGEEEIDYSRNELPRFGVVIVDEVDNMMIDDSSRTARLTGGLAGFEYLNPVFCGVANELNTISKRITKVGEKIVYLDGEFEEEEENLYLGKETKIHEIDNLYEFISKQLTEFTTKIIKEKVIELPEFLRDFRLKFIEELVESAIQSWGIYERRDYLAIKDKNKNLKIAPVDYNSTGIVQDGMTYSNGLHQFLQIRHGHKLIPETVVTSFISNLRYFKKYRTKIYGMTGTVGSKEEQDLISSIYKIDFGFIPTYKAKQFKELEGIVASDKTEWYINIITNTIQEKERGRAILVICKTIEDASTIYNFLIKVDQRLKIRLYSRNDNDNDECSAVKEKVDSGDIIIATNLAGRGTDIKTSTRVEKNGGLHVIVTFLPSNSRVEKQAFGRTARQGAKGTAQLIIDRIYTEKHFNVSNVLNNIYEFKQFRNCREYIRMLETKLYKTEEVELRDILFEIYLEVDKYLREIEKKKIEEKTAEERKEGDIYQYKLLQIEEKWGIELKKFQKTLAYDINTQEKLNKIARNFGFKPDELHNTDKKIFSLYNAINISLKNNASSEHLLWFTLGHFLDTFTKRYNKRYQYIEYNNIFDANFYEKAAESFNDQEALKSLVSILRRNIVIISSNQESTEIYKIKDSKETIYIGLAAGSKKYYRNYIPLIKDSNNNKTIEKYPIITEVEAAEYKSNVDLFGRKEIRKLLDEIIKRESEEIKKYNLIVKQESINYFKTFFNEIKEAYMEDYKIMINPAYMVQIGIKKSKVKEKIDILEGACNLEKNFSLPANYNLAHAIIEEQEEGYKQKAFTKLSIAKNRIDEILIPQLEYMQLTLLLRPKNNFNIEDYISKKAVSIFATLFSIGLETLSSYLNIPIAKTSDPTSISSLLTEIGLNMVITKIIQKLLDTGAEKILNQFREEVKETILKELRVSLDDPTILTYLNKLLAKDALCEEGECNGLAINTLQILEDKQNIFRELIDSGLEEILKSEFPILKEISIVIKGTDIVTTLSGINKVAKETAKEISKVFKNNFRKETKAKNQFKRCERNNKAIKRI
ncbi:14360_t:CDS:2 [Racocetra fulgida]|uniref:14360_t:CDS:1 n=1 Tax=Racocetra fulgida TaxID=60492 RepID=A0A9N9B9Z6_9GLOM|nr:14360_t:CDS:2 [Racocetra fulgida]